MPWPQFTWNPLAHQYRAADGRFVPRRQVRQALDEAIDAARAELVASTRQLQSGALDLGSWQLRVEGLLRSIHVMGAAVGAGGWAQATAADWSAAANQIKAAYVQTERLARKLEAGEYELTDGRLANWMSGLGAWGSGTYETALRKRDLASGRCIAERRLLHSGNPCSPCLGYHALGWQPPGTLPDIGTECICKKFCRCTFQRRMKRASKAGKPPVPAAPVPQRVILPRVPIPRPARVAKPRPETERDVLVGLATPAPRPVPETPRFARVLPTPARPPVVVPAPAPAPPTGWRRTKQIIVAAARTTWAKAKRFFLAR